jgi:hypothetical protein
MFEILFMFSESQKCFISKCRTWDDFGRNEKWDPRNDDEETLNRIQHPTLKLKYIWLILPKDLKSNRTMFKNKNIPDLVYQMAY